MTCKFCNHENPDNAAFCNNCGKSIHSKPKQNKTLGFRLFDIYTRFLLPISSVYLFICFIVSLIANILFLVNSTYTGGLFTSIVCFVFAIYQWIMYMKFEDRKPSFFLLFFIMLGTIIFITILVLIFACTMLFEESEFISTIILTLLSIPLSVLLLIYMFKRRKIFTIGHDDFGLYHKYRISKAKQVIQKFSDEYSKQDQNISNSVKKTTIIPNKLWF